MNDAPPEARVEDGAALREPLTIADAARRAGVHPNTIRRLIRQGRVAARMVRGRYGDTWLVESADIDRAVGSQAVFGGHAGQAGQSGQSNRSGQGSHAREAVQGAWSGPIDAPDGLPAATDLSLDRARALERYTHGLLQPLVDLLREREAAMEGKDALIRSQAERIGRLERELELLRATPRPPTPAQPTAPPAQPSAPAGGPPPAHATASAPPSGPVLPASPADDLPEHVTSLAGQVGRLRAELQLIAAALRAPEEPAEDEEPDAGAAGPAEESPLSEQAPLPAPLPGTAPMSPTTAITMEEMAGLFPAAPHGRLTLQPLDDDTSGTVAEPSAPGAEPATAPDPFADAEAAVAELRRALGPDGTGGADQAPNSAAAQHAAAAPGADASAPERTSDPEPARATESKRRRWWWPW